MPCFKGFFMFKCGFLVRLAPRVSRWEPKAFVLPDGLSLHPTGVNSTNHLQEGHLQTEVS